MKARLLVAAVCIPALLVILYALPPIAMTILVAAMCGLSVHELLHTTCYVRNRRMLVICILAAAASMFSGLSSTTPASFFSRLSPIFFTVIRL